MEQCDQLDNLLLCFRFVCVVQRLKAYWVALCGSTFALFLTTQKNNGDIILIVAPTEISLSLSLEKKNPETNL